MKSEKILALSGKHIGTKQHGTIKSEGNHPKMLILKIYLNQTTLGTIKNEGNHPKCSFLSRKHLGAKQHWEPQLVKGIT